MKKFHLFGSILSGVIFFVLFSCNSGSDDKNAAQTDSLKKDSLERTDFLTKYDRYFNDIARFIAGMEQTKGSTLLSFDTLEAAKEYRQSIGAFFDKLEVNNLSKMRVFSDQEFKDIRKDSLMLFYPFSGPDFINSDALFPEVFNTIMLGLEPVGGVPNISNATNDDLKTMFKALRISIDSISPLGYFMTNEMNKDFRRVSGLNGTLPIITLFMVRRGYQILNVKKVSISAEGKLVDSDPTLDKDIPTDNYVSGGLIEYMKNNDKRVRRLVYFSHDASDESLARTPELMKYFNSFKADIAFFKAASYLCTWMKGMREFTISNAKTIVQDDSGIPLSYFDKSQWDIRYYGKYERTLKVFSKGFFQKDLKEAYGSTPNIKPLDFVFGYGVRIKQSNMMVAKRK